MREENKEILKLTAKEILRSFFDIPIDVLLTSGKRGPYKKSINEYYRDRNFQRYKFSQKIYYLKKRGLIKTFIENKEHYIELTSRGAKELAWSRIGQTLDREETRWDGLFRIVIFDIPEDKRLTRDIIREKLKEIGFIQIQKSVFAYPFECKKEIDAICYYCSAKRYLKYMIANIIEGEEDLIDYFLENKVLTREDLNVIK